MERPRNHAAKTIDHKFLRTGIAVCDPGRSVSGSLPQKSRLPELLLQVLVLRGRNVLPHAQNSTQRQCESSQDSLLNWRIG